MVFLALPLLSKPKVAVSLVKVLPSVSSLNLISLVVSSLAKVILESSILARNEKKIETFETKNRIWNEVMGRKYSAWSVCNPKTSTKTRSFSTTDAYTDSTFFEKERDFFKVRFRIFFNLDFYNIKRDFLNKLNKDYSVIMKEFFFWFSS